MKTDGRTRVEPAPVAAPDSPDARRSMLPRALVGVAIVAALVAALVVALAIALRDGDSASVDTTPGSPTTAVPATVTTAPATTLAPPSVAGSSVLWPFPGSTIRYTTPEDAARSFATEFLRFEAPQLEPYQGGDSRSGEIPIRPAPGGPITTVLVRQVGPGEDWSVLGAVSENIEVTEPQAMTEIASPVRVAGRALAFEGTVQVEVRAAGTLGAIGEGFVTGGGNELLPFEGTVAFETPPSAFGALVFFSTSAENGQVWEAATLGVAFRSTDIDAAACGGARLPRPQPASGEMEVKAYVTCDADDSALRPVYRLVPRSPRVLQASLVALLAGPTTAEREASLGSWFSSDTAGMLRSVTIDEGHAVVDLDDLRRVIPNASSSSGSERLLAQLDATVFQFRSVESVEYRIEGSCEDFNEWLQFGGCTPRTRPAGTD